MKNTKQYNLIGGIFLTLLVLFSPNVFSQTATVQFRTIDKVLVTADLYVNKPATAPFIILFHQAKYSRGEYYQTAPKLNALGFNCMAVDLRSGAEINGIENKTFNYADSLGMHTRYIDAYDDMRAAVSYVRSKYPNAKVILMGSSYSASLAIKLAADFPKGIDGVIAFSPSDNFSKFGWHREIIQMSASRVKCPVFIASGAEEKEQWQKIYDAIPVATKSSFTPATGGQHGSKALWSTFPDSDKYWSALKVFLARY